MSAPTSRPVHPCILNLSDFSRGAEFSCWARITPDSYKSSDALPNLVTAAASSIVVYSVHPDQKYKLRIEHTFGNLAGSVISLDTLPSPSSSYQQDGLLVGFAGHARLTILQVKNNHLHAITLLDLTPALNENAYGAASVLEQDMIVTVDKTSRTKKTTTAACILGGGVAVAVVSIHNHQQKVGNEITSFWHADEPYIVPLQALQLPHISNDNSLAASSNAIAINQNLGQSISTGFGDILDAEFLQGYLEPVLVLLHTDPLGRITPGRLGRAAPPCYCTALSVSTPHSRTALLWSTPVPTDAFKLYSAAQSCVIVMGANSLTFLGPDGNVGQCMAVNGWAHSTAACTSTPNIAVKLAIQLDGSRFSWISDQTAVLVLRRGQLYLLQQIYHGGKNNSKNQWTLLPTGQTLGSVGEVADLVTLPFEKDWSTEQKTSWLTDSSLLSSSSLSLGLIFTGSRLGDSLLLGFAMETASVPWKMLGAQKDDLTKNEESASNDMLDSWLTNGLDDEILRLEEEALYAPVEAPSTTEPDVVPMSDEDDGSGENASRKRARVESAQFTAIRSITPLDTLVNLGPVGVSCEGPIERTPEYLLSKVEEVITAKDENPIFGASAHIFPTGYGSSGGLGLLTLPGKDDRMIIAEDDCLNAECIFSLPTSRMICMGMSQKSGGGIRLLRLMEDTTELQEVKPSDWCSEETISEIFSSSCLLAATESENGHPLFIFWTATTLETVILLFSNDNEGIVQLQHKFKLDQLNDNIDKVSVSKVSSPVSHGSFVLFGCLWSNGNASVVAIDESGHFSNHLIEKKAREVNDMDVDEAEDDLELKGLQDFYSDGSITAIDVLIAPKAFFVKAAFEEIVDEKVVEWNDMTVEELQAEVKRRGLKVSGSKGDFVAALESDDRPSDEEKDKIDSIFDEEDEELYGIERPKQQRHTPRMSPFIRQETALTSPEEPFVAIIRKNGNMELYSTANTDRAPELLWTFCGASLGLSLIQNNDHRTGLNPSLPRSHKVSIQEVCFHRIGPTGTAMRTFAAAMITSDGDEYLYKIDAHSSGPCLQRIPLHLVARPSQEQGRHQSKLIRKGIIAKDTNSDDLGIAFDYNVLHRITALSGQDCLFSIGARPTWVISERGRLTTLAHRTRHAAPAGGRPRPITGFCSGLKGAVGFASLHERVGRVGSQRITLFRELSNVFNTNGIILGSGFSLEKIHLGVTVQKIAFIKDEKISTGLHPLYALLVSREIEASQSDLNSDGLSDEERDRIEAEKEAAKIQRQVEADLGGFDVESEWVESIERENCFRVDTKLGGAPPIQQSLYSLWIVDAANKWRVVDSYEFGEYEHALDLAVMPLTEFKEEPGSSTSAIADEDGPKRTFVTVGTGIVNHDGEDVATKGRTLLFEVKLLGSTSSTATSPLIDLSLVYEKEIFHGPVTTVSCLSSEGRYRLVIGAGSDVNVEQWGSNGKLTQVGFFRATMHILDIMHFKNFFVLSDAYDSLYFLVWRESDKSLTLLAKDYDPIQVYATGMMARGASMTFVCHDDRQNLQFFQYAPGEAAARGGNKLVCRADFHLGSQLIGFVPNFCRPSLLVHSASPASTFAALKQQDPLFGRQDDEQRIGLQFGTMDGQVGSIVPLSEPVYWRMMALQSVMSNALDSDCALSQRAWRLYRRSQRRGGCRSNDRKKNSIDGDLIIKFADLATADQEDIASAIGTTVDLILDNILEIGCSSALL